MREQFKEIEQQLQWKEKFHIFLEQLEQGKEINISFPTNDVEIKFYITQAKEWMDHNEEKYRDKEGKEFYARIQNFVTLLKTSM